MTTVEKITEEKLRNDIKYLENRIGNLEGDIEDMRYQQDLLEEDDEEFTVIDSDIDDKRNELRDLEDELYELQR